MKITKSLIALCLLCQLCSANSLDEIPALSLIDAIKIAEKEIADKKLPKQWFPRSASLHHDYKVGIYYYEIAYNPPKVWSPGTTNSEIEADASLEVMRVSMDRKITYATIKPRVEFQKPTENRTTPSTQGATRPSDG